jgi:hypothetical protein
MSGDLTFQLYINLGNDAMRTADDLAGALQAIAEDVRDPRAMAPFAYTDEDGNLEAGYFQTIFDGNGNDVDRVAAKEKGA